MHEQAQAVLRHDWQTPETCMCPGKPSAPMLQCEQATAKSALASGHNCNVHQVQHNCQDTRCAGLCTMSHQVSAYLIYQLVART